MSASHSDESTVTGREDYIIMDIEEDDYGESCLLAFHDFPLCHFTHLPVHTHCQIDG